jgi:hypothetical protein
MLKASAQRTAVPRARPSRSSKAVVTPSAALRTSLFKQQVR